MSTNAAKDAALAKLNAKTAKQFKTPVSAISDSASMDIPRFSSGSPALDHALGGGFPFGRIIELFGGESTGKTTLALEAIAALQEKDPESYALFVDIEYALNRELVQAIGIDEDRLIIVQPDSGTDAMDVIREYASSGLVDIIVLDSTAALVTPEEIGKSASEHSMASAARILSQELKKVVGPLGRSNTALFIISQLRSSMNPYGSPTSETGGKAVKFYSSIRVSLSAPASKRVSEGNDIVAQTVTAKVVKNKTATPFREATYKLVFGKGIDAADGVFTIAVTLGIINKPTESSTTYFRYYKGADLEPVEEKLAIGKTKAQLAVSENKELFEEVKASVEAALKQGLKEALPTPAEREAQAVEERDADPESEETLFETQTHEDDEQEAPAF